MSRRRLTCLVCLTLLFSIGASAETDGGKVAHTASVDPLLLEVDWEATKNLVFVELPSEGHLPSEATARFERAGQPLFVETLRLEPTLRPTALLQARRAMQILAYQPDERAWLLESLRAAPKEAIEDFRVEIELDGSLVVDGLLVDVLAASDALRQQGFWPVPSSSEFVDGVKAKGIPQDENCPLVATCHQDHSQCRETACSGLLDAQTCLGSCDRLLKDCLSRFIEPSDPTDCGPPPPPPTCTPGVVGTSTTTELISSDLQGVNCLLNLFYPYDPRYHQKHLQFHQTTVRETRRRANCTTYTVVLDVTYSSGYCYKDMYAPCSFAYQSPSCIFF